MRIGRSLTRSQPSNYRPARVTVAVLVFIPEQTGYFKHRLDVLKLCLQSIMKHTDTPYELLIFDNGSCSEVVDYLTNLKDAGFVHYLILSRRNIGKWAAFQILFEAAPGEYVAYSDDDVLFHPGWLPAHLEISSVFPEAGLISGFPVHWTFSYGDTSGG